MVRLRKIYAAVAKKDIIDMIEAHESLWFFET